MATHSSTLAWRIPWREDKDSDVTWQPNNDNNWKKRKRGLHVGKGKKSHLCADDMQKVMKSPHGDLPALINAFENVYYIKSVQKCQLYFYACEQSKKPGMGRHTLLQWIFLTQGMNPGLLHCRQILYHLSHQGSPSICPWGFSSQEYWSG